MHYIEIVTLPIKELLGIAHLETSRSNTLEVTREDSNKRWAIIIKYYPHPTPMIARRSAIHEPHSSSGPCTGWQVFGRVWDRVFVMVCPSLRRQNARLWNGWVRSRAEKEGEAATAEEDAFKKWIVNEKCESSASASWSLTHLYIILILATIRYSGNIEISR